MILAKTSSFPPPIVTGDDYVLEVSFYAGKKPKVQYPVDLMEFSSQMRVSAAAPETVAEFVVEHHPTDEWIVTFSLPYTVTVDLEPGKYAWDIQVIDNQGERSTLFQGHEIEVLQDTTR